MSYQYEMTFVRITPPFIFGILLFYPVKNLFWLGCCQYCCCFILTALVFIVLFYKNLKLYRFKGSIGLTIHFLFFFLGGLSCISNDQSLKTNFYANKKSEYLKLLVNSEPILKNGILTCQAIVLNTYKTGTQIIENNTSGLLKIAVKVDTLAPIKLAYGSEVLIPMKIKHVPPALNPGEFNYQSWLAARNIYFQTFLQQGEITHLRNNMGNPVIDFALKLRADQVSYYRKILKNNEAFNVAATLILGYRADLAQSTLDIYSKTGTIHALSVSGMHVGLIYLILNWLLFFMDRNTILKILKTMIIIILIWFYALITGFSPSVLRSAIMLSLFIIAKTCSKNSNSYNILAFSALCLLIYDPYLIWDVGFQLSFLAVMGIIWIQPMILNWWYVKSDLMHKTWSIVALSLSAQLITYPLSIYYFHQFPVYFLISNLFITLPMTLLMYLGLLVLFIRIDALAFLFEWLIVFTNDGLKWIADLPLSSYTAIWINKAELILLYAALVSIVFSLSGFKKKILFIGFSCLLGFYSLLAYDKLVALNQRYIVIFNLKKYYSTAFIDGNQAIILSELKEDNSAFKYTIRPFLDSCKIDKLTVMDGERDTVISGFKIKNDTIEFYNYQLDKNELKNRNASFQQFSL